jgi:flotillin
MNLAPLLIPVVIVGLAATLLGVVITFARNYVKCAPNEVLVVFGKKMGDKGYRLITGGATFVWPVFEAYQRISLDTFQVEFAIEDSPNIDGVPVTVQALANLKISSEAALLANAVERLLELGNDPKRLEQLSRSTLEGQLRMIVGTLKVEEIIQDREKISGQVLSVSKGELNKLGLEVDIFVIQKIADAHGYIEALGKKATAEVKRDASIGEAEAERDATIRTADARRDARKRAALADQEASITEAQAAQAVSDADRDRDQQIAKNAARVKSEQARVEIAAQTAAAEESKLLKVAEVSAEEAEVQARTKLQEKERERKDAEMKASVIVSATREKEALLIRAGAEQEAAVMQGEAARVRKEKEGEGERAYLTAQAIGRKAAAEADLAEKEASANGQKAVLLATAEGTRAQGEAEGTAVKAKLLAEAEGMLKSQLAIAEGILKKNEAMAQMSPEALRVITLELLPKILTHSGEALEKALGAAMEPVGQGLAAVDSVHVIDMGGGGAGDGNPLSKITGAAPAALVQLMTGLRAVGIDPTRMLGILGLDVSDYGEMFGGALATNQAESEADDGNDAVGS